LIPDTFKKQEKKETPRRKRWAYYKGKLNGDKKGKPKEAVAVRYYILQTMLTWN
jgi:hypothetical protein